MKLRLFISLFSLALMVLSPALAFSSVTWTCECKGSSSLPMGKTQAEARKQCGRKGAHKCWKEKEDKGPAHIDCDGKNPPPICDGFKKPGSQAPKTAN